MIEARVIADSRNPDGNRLTTFVVTYPRIILSEVNTHRILSRNSASSRAIPVEKMLARVVSNPFFPTYWGKNQKGMQADTDVDASTTGAAKSVWGLACLNAVTHAEQLVKLGIHKQIANRLLEPFSYTTTIITASEWGNFFNLRAHKDAQPEFQELAFKMLVAYRDSNPTPKAWGEWHLPFGDQYLPEGLDHSSLLKITTARCARVSYLNFEGNIDHAKDYVLHDDLLSSGHMSPFEHAAYAEPYPLKSPSRILSLIRHTGPFDFFSRVLRHMSNFRGWVQYRKLIPNENRERFDPAKLLEARKVHG